MKPTEDTSDANNKQETLLSHLYELRSRLLWIVGSVFAVFICLFPFANKLYAYLAGPLMAHLPEGSSMVAIDVASPFLTPFKLVFLISLVLAIPIILFHAWAFIARVCMAMKDAWCSLFWFRAPCFFISVWHLRTSLSSH